MTVDKCIQKRTLFVENDPPFITHKTRLSHLRVTIQFELKGKRRWGSEVNKSPTLRNPEG